MEYSGVSGSQAGLYTFDWFTRPFDWVYLIINTVLLSLVPVLLRLVPSLLSLVPVLLSLGPVLHRFWTSLMPHVYTRRDPKCA